MNWGCFPVVFFLMEAWLLWKEKVLYMYAGYQCWISPFLMHFYNFSLLFLISVLRVDDEAAFICCDCDGVVFRRLPAWLIHDEVCQCSTELRKIRPQPSTALTTGKYTLLTLILLVADLANTKWCKKPEKWLKPWHMVTHLTVLSMSYSMNTNITGLRWF